MSSVLEVRMHLVFRGLGTGLGEFCSWVGERAGWVTPLGAVMLAFWVPGSNLLQPWVVLLFCLVRGGCLLLCYLLGVSEFAYTHFS